MKNSFVVSLSFALVVGLNSPAFAVDTPSFGRFHELPLTSIEPRGWLKQYLINQRDGLTGHLENAGYPFNTAGWAAKTIPENHSIEDWWPYEQNAYWVDGMIRCGRLLNDDFLVQKAHRSIDYVLAHPAANGYLGPLLTSTSAEMGRWIDVVFFRALMAEYSATGDRHLADAVRRHYLADRISYAEVRDSLNIEPMLWAYGVTRDDALLKYAKSIYTVSNENLTDTTAEKNLLIDGPVREHGVTYNERAKLGALLYLYTGEDHYLQTSVAAFHKLDQYHRLAPGVNVSSEFTGPVTTTESYENCDISDHTWSEGYLLMATGSTHYADEIELAAFNAAPGSVGSDFKTLQYFSAPNQVVCTHTSFPKSAEAQMSFSPNPGTECCPANVSRCMPNFTARLWMRGAEKEIAAVMYSPSKVRFKSASSGRPIEIVEETTYPFSDTIKFKIHTEKKARFAFTLRIPGWCNDATIAIDGQRANLPTVPGSFVTLDREFADGTIVTLALPYKVAVLAGPSGTVSIQRGPLLYSLKIAEKWTVNTEDKRSTREFPAYDVNPQSAWNYALAIDASNAEKFFTVVNKTVSDQPWSVDQAPIEIQVPARRVTDWTIHPVAEVEAEHWDVIRDPMTKKVTKWVQTGTDRHVGTFLFTPPVPTPNDVLSHLDNRIEMITLIPYGCAKLRVTYFPLAPASRPTI